MFFDMPNELCKDCHRYAKFSEDCHFHWEGKRECSKYMGHEMDEEKYKTVIDSTIIF